LKKTFAAVVMMAALVAASGCKKNAEAPATTAQTPSPSQPAAPVANATIDINTAGTVSGTVKFPKKAPPRVEIDMRQDPACGLLGGTNMSEQYMVKDGKLANVYVYVKDGLGNQVYPAPTTAVTLDQKGCKYVPHVTAVMVGQPLQVNNSDPTIHNVHTMPQDGSPELNVSEMPRTGTTKQVFTAPQTMMPVRCNNHPWMEAFVNVAPNPFFAVTDENGHFEIHGLPPGTYTLVAVHEELGQQQTQVTVTSKQPAKADFTFGAGNAGGQ
jgi:hypothetical protein